MSTVTNSNSNGKWGLAPPKQQQQNKDSLSEAFVSLSLSHQNLFLSDSVLGTDKLKSDTDMQGLYYYTITTTSPSLTISESAVWLSSTTNTYSVIDLVLVTTTT